MNFTAIRERATIGAIRWAPKALYSAAIGLGARTSLPASLRAPLYRAFSRWVGARVDEAELPLSHYASLGEFFARRLRAGLRTVASEPGAVIAPCDGAVASVGISADGHLLQAKGRDYPLAELLVDPELAEALVGGSYITIYLSPRDYHRVHAPMPLKLLGYDYVPGTHWPVNPLFCSAVDKIMARNERVVFHCDTPAGKAALVMVAALGVSNIELAHDRLETRYLRRDKKHCRVRFERPIDVPQGEELGAFHLGSTVILIFAPDQVALDMAREGEAVIFGRPIGRICGNRDDSSVEP